MCQNISMRPLDVRSRQLTLIMTTTFAAMVIPLAVEVHRAGGPLQIDLRSYSVLYHYQLPTWIRGPVQDLGNWVPFASGVGVLTVSSLLLKDDFSAAVSVTGPPLAVFVAEGLLKPIVGRQENGMYGFPSGHATAVAALVAVVALLIYRRWGIGALLAATPFLLLLPALMTIGLVQTHWHQMSDAIAGDLIGAGTVLGIAWALSVGVARWQVRR